MKKRDRLYEILCTIRDNESNDYLYELAEEALELLDK